MATQQDITTTSLPVIVTSPAEAKELADKITSKYTHLDAKVEKYDSVNPQQLKALIKIDYPSNKNGQYDLWDAYEYIDRYSKKRR